MVSKVFRTSTHLSRVLSALTLVAGLIVVGCNSNEPPGDASPSVEPISGMRYFVGGPVMKTDRYGRLRLGGFNGEVKAPTNRGLLIGYKLDENNKFEFRTWLNGISVAKSNGFLDEDGLFWYTDRVTYDRNGKIIATQEFEYDDEKQIMISKLSHLDPESGDVLKSYDQEMPYTPPDDGGDDEDEDDEEEQDLQETP